MASSEGITDVAFKQLLTVFSDWYDKRGYLSMMKVLYRDLVSDKGKLSKAETTMELMNLVMTSGNLNPKDLKILYDTIKATGTFGLEEKIEAKIPSCPDIRDVIITKFTPYRKNVMNLGLALRDEDIVKISGLYNESSKEYVDPWSLIIDLENRMIIREGKTEKFINNLMELKVFYAVEALTEDIPIDLSLISKYKRDPKYPLTLLKEVRKNICGLYADDQQEFLSIFKDLASYIKSFGLDLEKLKEGSIIFYLSAHDSKALLHLWEIHSSKKLIHDLANILVPQEHQQEFLDEWRTYIDENEYKAALRLGSLKEKGRALQGASTSGSVPGRALQGASTSGSVPGWALQGASTSGSVQALSDIDFKRLQVIVSEWYDSRGYFGMLRVLFRDMVDIRTLEKATNTIELLNKLHARGHLNLGLLCDTISVTKQFGLQRMIKITLPSFPDVKERTISETFTPHRQKLMKFGMELTQDNVTQIDSMYNVPCMVYADSWSMITDLEHRMIIREGEMEDFIDLMKRHNLGGALVALTKDL